MLLPMGAMVPSEKLMGFFTWRMQETEMRRLEIKIFEVAESDLQRKKGLVRKDSRITLSMRRSSVRVVLGSCPSLSTVLISSRSSSCSWGREPRSRRTLWTNIAMAVFAAKPR